MPEQNVRTDCRTAGEVLFFVMNSSILQILNVDDYIREYTTKQGLDIDEFITRLRNTPDEPEMV